MRSFEGDRTLKRRTLLVGIPALVLSRPAILRAQTPFSGGLVSAGSGSATDPHFSNVVLLCHCDGANGSKSLTDNSNSAHTVTAAGAAGLTTSQFKFGTASLDNSTNASANSADSTDWDFGSGQFTLEAFVRTTTTISSARSILSQWRQGNTDLAWVFRFDASGNLAFAYSTNGTSTAATITGTTSISTNTWYCVAVDRDGSNNVRLYLDGAVVGGPTAAAVTFNNSTRTLLIGNEASVLQTWIGQIDEVRITKGVARYAGAFTAPTAAFPNS